MTSIINDWLPNNLVVDIKRISILGESYVLIPPIVKLLINDENE